MKKIKYIFISLIILFVHSKSVSAGSVSVWANANTVTVGSNVTISVNAKSIFGTFKIKVSDSSILSGPTSGNVDDNTETYTFNAKKEGTATITITPDNMADYDTEAKYNQSKSVSIKVVNKSTNNGGTTNNNSTTAEKKEYSSDNTLSSLSIDGYEITPKFNKDTLEYKLEVDEDVEKITIKGKTTDDKAEISGIGEKALTEGENKIEVKVTAENGNEKIYKIIVTVKDKNPITVTIDNKKYTIVKKNKDAIKKLDHYEEEKIKINNQEVISYINKVTKTRLVILKDKDNKLAYYIYNENTKKYQKYKSISVGNITLQILDYNKKIDNYKLYNIKINNEDIDIYKTKKNDEFGLIYGINIVTGNKSFYQYDEKEQTLARYNSKKNNNKLDIYKEETNKYKNYLMVSIGIICLILIIILITSLIKSKKHKRKS